MNFIVRRFCAILTRELEKKVDAAELSEFRVEEQIPELYVCTVLSHDGSKQCQYAVTREELELMRGRTLREHATDVITTLIAKLSA